MAFSFHASVSMTDGPEDFSPESWEPLFTPSQHAAWARAGSVVISATEDGSVRGKKWSLILEYMGDGCISLAYDNQASMFYFSNGSADEGFELLDSGATVPSRSRVSLEQAWPVVRAFLTDPSTRPHGDWIDSDDLDWGEDF